MSIKTFNEKDRGSLSVLDFEDLEFIPKRIFYIYNIPEKNQIRGEHAHIKSLQHLICIKGKILVTLFDGEKTQKIILKTGESCFIDKMIWATQKFILKSSILLVLTDTLYSRNDYITNLDEFVKLKKNI